MTSCEIEQKGIIMYFKNIVQIIYGYFESIFIDLLVIRLQIKFLKKYFVMYVKIFDKEFPSLSILVKANLTIQILVQFYQHFFQH